MRHVAKALAALVALAAGSAAAQTPPLQGGQDPGARAGNAYLPSTHTPGCGGLLCDSSEPQRLAAPPPPCQGLICGLSPYSMQRPVTAAEAQRMQEERARAEAAAASAAPPAKPERHRHRRVAKTSTKRTIAARTPDPTGAAPEAAK